MRRNSLILILVVIVFISFIGGLIWRFPDVWHGQESRMHLVYFLVLLAYLGLSLFSRQLNLSKAVQYFGIWLGVLIVVLGIYSYRESLLDFGNRIWQELVPFQGQSIAAGEIHFRMSANNHFVVEARVNGQPVRFMVDTGASRVVLSQHDAQRIGIKLEKLQFNQLTSTANGQTFSAPIRLKKIQVGDIVLHNVPGSVNASHLDQSLLGMSFLSRLRGYEVRGDVLILKQ